MDIVFLIIGLALTLIDIFLKIRTLKENIFKRIFFIVFGLATLYFVDKTFLYISTRAIFCGLIIGIVFMGIHILVAKGVKLKKENVNKGLIYTSLLIYGLELPAEEFLYRGIIFIPLLELFQPIVAISLTSVLFLGLHLKTWNNKFVWIGSLVLGLICAISVYLTKSIWTAIIIHNLNDFGFMTLVNKKNIFKEKYAD
ncbi:CPBP family intramembrane glutamic endopeptidase [Caloranaerobacter ferrireducens]|uniref:CPBP family intramembrane glutamic endopeptidase n=1 Tax=Caloranaerobacter ferrireducens TaxID=1323370 RepID=UPI00084DAF45|nr:CPBP family intramembrane glutamic endopeptidase [Caloranaerobacter ferrireducens]